MWQCKNCGIEVSRRTELLQHYRLKHSHFGRRHQIKCIHPDCPCIFKAWNSLLTHLSRSHTNNLKHTESFTTFTCQLCGCRELGSEYKYFVHIGHHLKNNETVTCVFKGCEYKTNVYSTFKSHKSRKHSLHSLADFKENVVQGICVAETGESSVSDKEFCDDSLSDDVGYVTSNDQLDVVEHKIAAVLLKLENIFHVPSAAIDELLDEFQYLLSTASSCSTEKVIYDTLFSHNLQLDQTVVEELTSTLCTSNPVYKSIGKGCPLATSFKRKKYYRDNFKVVEPIEYILDHKDKRTLQYVPLLKFLQELFTTGQILNRALDSHLVSEVNVNEGKYKSFRDGLFFKNNLFLSGGELRVLLNLYIDDFEICNPLGTSRKKHKICSIYWNFSNLPPGCHSSLSSIYLALLCRSDDVKKYGYEKVLEPLLRDLVILENQGIFIEQLGDFVKGTIQCVVADNLGAHGIAGFIESFSAQYMCRFCHAQRSEIQEKEVSSGAFTLRSKDMHEMHVRSALDSAQPCHGVKRKCVLSAHLSHFNVCTGYPPDVAHDLLEGIVPFELAHCLNLLITKKYFTLESLNESIQKFPFKWTDKSNCPHTIPRTFMSNKSIGGNAHENWSLLRFLPFFIGQRVPLDEPAWQVILDLKDLVELAVAPEHTTQSIAFLEAKICDHRYRLKEVFPAMKLLPKHHFVEHYPQMIRFFGPLVGLWTLRFEAKHSFFKKVVRHTHCFKNILLSLAVKHQFMMAYHLESATTGESGLTVSTVSTVSVDILHQDVQRVLHLKYPDIPHIQLTKNASVNGVNYREGMIVVHGSIGGLPEFAEVIQMIVVDNRLSFIVKELSAWYREHFRAFELCPTSQVCLVQLGALVDQYPLADYRIGGQRMVTLKRFINIQD
ncbi:uncharacterized protein LOC114481687 [Gouania willdenowi]|uniref:uncharacterized protein LOC114481687 n=1 Tax=Gouania willdenowi TaxID=441366 RepID=UPI001055E7FE|nr:uncharacterized protein LOC114481687 [Gouania willdenowi]